jgi:hypothetical protein
MRLTPSRGAASPSPGREVDAPREGGFAASRAAGIAARDVCAGLVMAPSRSWTMARTEVSTRHHFSYG